MPDLAAVLVPNALPPGGGAPKTSMPNAPMGMPGGTPDPRPGDFADHLALATGQGSAVTPSAPVAFPIPTDAERHPGTPANGIECVGDTPFWPLSKPATGIEIAARDPTRSLGQTTDTTEDEGDRSGNEVEASVLDGLALAPIVDPALPPMPDPIIASPANPPPVIPTETQATAPAPVPGPAMVAPPGSVHAAPAPVPPGPPFPVPTPGPDADPTARTRGLDQPIAIDPAAQAFGSEPTRPGPMPFAAPASPPLYRVEAGTPEAPASALPADPEPGNPASHAGPASGHAAPAGDPAGRRPAGEAAPIAAPTARIDPRGDDPGARRIAVAASRDATEAAQTPPDPTAPTMTALSAPDAPEPLATPPAAAEGRPAPAPSDQIAARVAPVLVRLDQAASGGQRLTIRLDPEELGQVEVRIERPEPLTARVHILVERPETLSLLRRDQAALERALDEAGVGTQARELVFDLADPAPAATVQAGAEARQDPSTRQDSPRPGADAFATLADQQGDRRSGQGDGRDRTADPGSAGMDRLGAGTLAGPPGSAAGERGVWRRPGLNITA